MKNMTIRSMVRKKWGYLVGSWISDLLFYATAGVLFVHFVLTIRDTLLGILPIVQDPSFAEALATGRGATTAGLLAVGVSTLKQQAALMFIGLLIAWILFKGLAWYCTLRMSGKHKRTLKIQLFGKTWKTENYVWQLSVITIMYAVVFLTLLYFVKFMLAYRTLMLVYPFVIMGLLSYFYYHNLVSRKLTLKIGLKAVIWQSIALVVFGCLVWVLTWLVEHTSSSDPYFFIVFVFVVLPVMVLIRLIYSIKVG